mmetsp:Transcript_47237/g.102586  ORF Transcript_47237/g.102586 Transcript_47237/m.102586 type:complete len:254 (-) Transcript_47237:251-1012(-)
MRRKNRSSARVAGKDGRFLASCHFAFLHSRRDRARTEAACRARTANAKKEVRIQEPQQSRRDCCTHALKGTADDFQRFQRRFDLGEARRRLRRSLGHVPRLPRCAGPAARPSSGRGRQRRLRAERTPALPHMAPVRLDCAVDTRPPGLCAHSSARRRRDLHLRVQELRVCHSGSPDSNPHLHRVRRVRARVEPSDPRALPRVPLRAVPGSPASARGRSRRRRAQARAQYVGPGERFRLAESATISALVHFAGG